MSARDKLFGGILCLLTLLITLVYFYVISPWGGPINVWFFTLTPFLLFEIVISLIFAFGMLILFWIGYTIMTTPSIEEIENKSK
ncbi:MAG: hypothetical protein QF475_03110 [Candidatus Undinarchaeales archaeon]|jgi:hypothetical protein|nr:hypothetical protein [Candidatus Undinarchaeales archaeon]